MSLPPYSKDIKKVLEEIIERNTQGQYTNISLLKKNHTRLRTTKKKINAMTATNRSTLEKRSWLDKFVPYFEAKYPIQREPWENRQSSNTGTYVLELAPLPADLDVGMMRAMVSAYLHPRLQFYAETKRSIYIEDEFSEWFTEKATGGRQIGKGHTAMDVETSAKDGIDAFCVIMKADGSGSNEKSLIQKFIKSGADLDTLFRDHKYIDIVGMTMKNYFDKVQDVRHRFSLRDLYYLGFISTTTNVFLVNFKINAEFIANVGLKYVTDSGTSIFLRNFIAERYGNVKLYKSKKRVELRLKPSILEHAVSVFELPTPISTGAGDGDENEE
jgi:hypothetical protein